MQKFGMATIITICWVIMLGVIYVAVSEATDFSWFIKSKTLTNALLAMLGLLGYLHVLFMQAEVDKKK